MNNRSGWDLGLACCTLHCAQRGSIRANSRTPLDILFLSSRRGSRTVLASRPTFFTLPQIGNIWGILFSSIGIDWKVVPRFKRSNSINRT